MPGGPTLASWPSPSTRPPVSNRINEAGQPGKQSAMRLLGTYEFVGETPKVAVDVVRNPSYALTPAIVQRARLSTLLSADGRSQTQATFQLRTKAAYLEVELPENAALWSAVLDGTPLKPQKRNKIRLIGLPPASTGAVRNLQLVYEAPVQNVTNGGRLNLKAPRLLYRANREAKESTEIPLVNIEWTVACPTATRPWPPTARWRPGRSRGPCLRRWRWRGRCIYWEAVICSSVLG